MRKILLTAFVAVLLTACNKKEERQTFQAEGTLTSYDPSQCPTLCCGGIFLTIDNDPVQYKIADLPNISWHDFMHLNLPRRISFDYQPHQFNCTGQFELITITNYTLH